MGMKTEKIVYFENHDEKWANDLRFWLSCHPRTKYWGFGSWGDVHGGVVMSTSSFRTFCKDYDYKFKEL